jgi:hypothetical protein
VLADASKDIVYLRNLLSELGLQHVEPTTLFSNNQSCIKIALNLVFHARTKHIEIQYHFIREKIKSKEVDVDYIPIYVQHADFLTKPLSYRPFSLNIEESGVKPLP